MPRGPVVYSLPAGTVPKVPLETIKSAEFNAFATDVQNTFNTPQPIEYGGTNATTAAGARTNLGVVAGTVSKMDTRRNRLVNGDKLVSQENGQTAGTGNGRYLSDQNAMYFVSSAGTFTGVNVLTLSPAGGYRDRITITTADASLAAGEYLTYTQNIEGSNIRDAKWGTAGAVQIIVRRGFKFPAGTYTVAFHNAAVNRSYLTSFVVSGGEANTDIVREFAVPGDITGTWLSTDGVIGLTMDVVIAAGSTFQGVAGWQAGNVLTIAGATNGIATAAAVYEFFDEGLKLDPDATGSYGVYEAGEVDTVYMSERYLELSGGNFAWTQPGNAGTALQRVSMLFRTRKSKVPTVSVVVATGSASFIAASSTLVIFGSAGTTMQENSFSWTANARL